jgi:hypothetical protein
VIDAATIAPEKLRLYAFVTADGRRELTSDAEPVLITVVPLGGSLYRIEAVNEVPNGEYALTVPGSDQFFCFSVF